MKKLAKYLKPYTLMILISIALLFGQAMADLNLPNYMSEIVNIGIQQSGIEDAAPEAISAKGLTFVTGFMTEEQKKAVADSYTLVPSSGSGDSYDDAARRYPLLRTEDIYVRGSVDSETLTQLDRAFGESAWTLINTMKTLAQQSGKSLTDAAGGKTDVSEMDLSKVYALGPVLEKLPAGVIENARSEALKNSAAKRHGNVQKLLPGAGDEYLRHPDRLYPQNGSADASHRSGGRRGDRDGRLFRREAQRRCGARPAPCGIQKGRKLFQPRVRRIFDRFSDYPYHQ